MEADTFCSGAMVQPIDIDQEDIIRRLDAKAFRDPISRVYVPNETEDRNRASFLGSDQSHSGSWIAESFELQQEYVVQEGDTLYIHDEICTHSLGNDSDKDAVSLHVYAPSGYKPEIPIYN